MLLIVQARYNSSRLPGKVLKTLSGKPMLQWIPERLNNSQRVRKIFVATSEEKTDDPIEDFCLSSGWSCFRGNLNSVADRFAQIVHREKIPAFVRISGDSPLIDPEIVDQAIQLYETSERDLVTNILVRTFPKGQSVEVLKADTFLKTLPDFDPSEQEHVTPYYYKHPEKFRMIGFTSGEDAGKCQLSVDTLEDFQRVEQLLEKTSNKPGCWKQLWQMSQQLEG